MSVETIERELMQGMWERAAANAGLRESGPTVMDLAKRIDAALAPAQAVIDAAEELIERPDHGSEMRLRVALNRYRSGR